MEAPPPGHILVVDDDPMVADVVLRYLEKAGHRVTLAGDGITALRLYRQARPALVVLDIMLPKLSGIQVCQTLRAESDVPVIMLTALGDEDDRIEGLRMGADDYIAKPFSPRELVLRVESVLRRSATAPPAPLSPPLADGTLRVDTARRVVDLAGEPLALTLREYDLLVFLMRHPGQAFSRSELLEQVWGWSFGDDSTVTVHVRRLREKIESDPSQPSRIVTVWGIGYRYELSDD